MKSENQNQASVVSQLPLLDVLSPLWTRWRLLILVFLLSLAATLSLIPLVQEKYKSEAVLILDRASNDIATFDTPLTSLVIDSEAIASEIEILFSGELAASVIESERLLDTDEFNPDGKHSDVTQRAAVKQFLEQLDLQRKGISRAIVVKFESTDASRAARIVNAIVARYLEHELERKIEQESIATRRLNDDISTLEERIAESEVRIAEYRQQVGQSGTGDETRRERNIVGLNAQRVVAQAESTAADALLQQARSLANNPAAFAALPSSDISPALSRLRNNELDLQTKLDQLALTYGEKHPQVQQAGNQLSRTRRDIRIEIDKSLQVLEGTTQNARLRVTALAGEIEALDQAESGTWSRRAQLLALERQRESDVNRLEFYSSRLRELSQSSSIENLKPFARVITTGQISDTAEFPNRRNLLLLLPALMTLACLGLLVVSGLFRRFTMKSLPALPENTSWFGRIPTASLFRRLPWTAGVFADKGVKISVRTLCNGIDTALAGEGRVLMLTGLGHDTGTSFIASAVARQYAASGQSTVLISLDLRKPVSSKGARVLYASDLLSMDITQASINQTLQLEKRSGLFRLALQLQAGSGKNLHAVEKPRDLAIEELLSSNALEQLFHTLSARFSRIILDLPPVMDAPDSAIVARLADLSLIVTTPASLSGQVVELYRGIQRLHVTSGALLGIVLNRMDVDMSDAPSLDYVASDHHHASVTHGIAANADKRDSRVASASIVRSRQFVSPGSVNEQPQSIRQSDQTEKNAVQNASMMATVPNRLLGESWLLRQSAQQFTLCLTTTLSRPDGGHSELVDAVDLPLACYLRRTPEGHAEYVMLLGLFNSHQAAKNVQDRLIIDQPASALSILPLSAVHRDILRYRSVASGNGKVQFDKVVA